MTLAFEKKRERKRKRKRENKFTGRALESKSFLLGTMYHSMKKASLLNVLIKEFIESYTHLLLSPETSNEHYFRLFSLNSKIGAPHNFIASLFFADF